MKRTVASRPEPDRRVLAAAVAVARAELKRYLASRSDAAKTKASTLARELQVAIAEEKEVRRRSEGAALERLVRIFRLSEFERRLLAACAGVVIDPAFAELCERAWGRRAVSLGLALGAFGGAHWTAVTPRGALRRWRLLEVSTGAGLLEAPAILDERVLHYLVGVDEPDERIASVARRVGVALPLSAAQESVAGEVVEFWTAAADQRSCPLVILQGGTPAERRAVAASAASAGFGSDLWQVDASALGQGDTETWRRLWDREALLTGAVLLLEGDDGEAPAAGLGRLAEQVLGPVVLSGGRWHEGLRARRRFDVPTLGRTERAQLWARTLGPKVATSNGVVARAADQFLLPADLAIEAAGRVADVKAKNFAPAFWEACRQLGRAQIDDLASRIASRAGWTDLVLPPPQLQMLREMVAAVRQQNTVTNAWGFAEKSARGLGLAALFAGESGTGKTMAAEVLANELKLDLYRIDLSAVVSKYIGETEKNLRRVFDAADLSGAILLFDEADALFGKRTEVRDSHDRYANIEVGYLLQRMETYRGLAILTTNLRRSLDEAFLRRLRFIVNFPFPDAAARREIWQQVFPPRVPKGKLDYERLARLNVAGGSIRNIALGAAVLAADEGKSVEMRHLAHAARAESAKLERTLAEAELAGWEEGRK